ncbi:hypothetical protein [Escherichia phage vB_EcoM_JNE01]|mgnify:CR=1 FL=1|nr:hypothetical protein [Escherichia phage vB_EcoM_JNE01]
MQKTLYTFKKWYTFTLPGDKYFDQQDDEYYKKETLKLLKMAKQALSVYNSSLNVAYEHYRITAKIDEEDGELSFFEYDIVYFGYTDDEDPINVDKIRLDLTAISVILKQLAEMCGLIET